jgi:hypothetical protein
MTWKAAFMGFLIALPELVKLIRPLVEFFTELLGPNPAKKAAELGEVIREFVDAEKEVSLKEKRKKKRAALEKLADFAHSN